MTTPTLEDRVTEALTTRAESITIDRPPPLGSLLDRSGPGSSGGRHRPNATAIAAGLVAFVLLSAALLIATRVPRDADRPATTSVLPAPVIVPRVGLDLPEAEIRQVVNLVDPWDPSAFPPHTPTSTSSPRAIYRHTGGDFAAPWFVLAPVSIGPAGTVGLPTFPPPDAEDLGDGAKLWFVDPVGGIAMDVYTDQPGVQLFTAPDFSYMTGKGGVQYGIGSSFCLETQHFADAMNHENFPSIVLQAGEVFSSETIYRFRVE